MVKEIFSVDNLEIHKGKDSVIISVNPKIYPLDIIFSAAYIFIDKVYVIVDGDLEEEILVQLRPKDKNANLEILGREFNNELINYSFYAAQTNKNMELRTAIIQRAFLTSSQESDEPSAEEVVESPEEELGESHIEDPLGIAIPWEEKHGREKSGKNHSKKKKC